VLSEDVDPATGLPRVYQVGKGGFLEPYDMENYQRGRSGADVSVSGEGSGSSSGSGDAQGGVALTRDPMAEPTIEGIKSLVE